MPRRPARNLRSSLVPTLPCLLVLLLAAGWGAPASVRAADPPATKHVVIVAGKKSHGPVGNGIHDYGWSAKLLKVMLDNSNVAGHIDCQIHSEGWPADQSSLERADTILVISDGRDGDLFEEAPFLENAQRAEFVGRQIARGCGFLTFHFSTFAPDSLAPQVLDWTGGYFDWETAGKRQWYSAIKTLEAEVELGDANHPVARGLVPVKLREEFYYNLRFAGDEQGVSPIWKVPALDGREPDGRVVAWARQRKQGGRGFGTTCGHFYDNWRQSQFRKLILNALVWTAGGEVPEGGVEARYYSHAEITAALGGITSTERALVDDRPIRVLIFAGNEAHRWHNWEKTTPAIQAFLERDPRIQVQVSHDIEDLAREPLQKADVIVQNYVNWHDPTPLSPAARTAFVRFLENGGGLVLVHFANGAWHSSLPMAGPAAWPEYRNIVRRMWDHQGQSGHDAFGRFLVRPTELEDPLTAGLKPFEVTDELYFRQAGDQPIEPLITARSKVTGADEPLAWTSTYGKGRIFQTLLGHSEQTYNTFEPREMLRRAVAWSAGRKIVPIAGEEDLTPPKVEVPPLGELLREGRFGQAFETRKGGAIAKGRPEYRDPEITVELSARLFQKEAYNILIASELKSSSTHWELFTQPGTGRLTLFSPGMQPDHVTTEVDLADGRWHEVGYIRESSRVRLFVDGKPVADQQVTFREPKSGDEGLGLGTLVGREIGCAAWLDEVRISRGVRIPAAQRNAPLEADEQTLGLWHCDRLEGSGLVDESRFGNPFLVLE